MKIEINEEKYDELQDGLIDYLTKRIKSILEEKEVAEESIYDITGDLVFEIAAIIDSSAIMGTEEDPILPFLAFSKSESERDSLIADVGGSSLHEKAYGTVEQIFEIE
ncbi:hypothetical protein [Rheinheimera sp. WS51]|uniref:hypothetical protein n=1 Tax=Rheinheimera sp. WS51 TaxID=3425886 RepID=UPI003D90619E